MPHWGKGSLLTRQLCGEGGATPVLPVGVGKCGGRIGWSMTVSSVGWYLLVEANNACKLI